MKGIIISGKEISEEILQDLKTKVDFHTRVMLNRAPKLVVITIGEDPASKVYVRNKEKACEKVGILFENIRFTEKDLPTDINFTKISTTINSFIKVIDTIIDFLKIYLKL